MPDDSFQGWGWPWPAPVIPDGARPAITTLRAAIADALVDLAGQEDGRPGTHHSVHQP